MLTRRGRLVIWSSIVLLVAGRILGVTELFAVAAAGLAAVAVAVARVRTPNVRAGLQARVSPAVLSVGDPARLELSVENAGMAPIPAGRLRLLSKGGGGLSADVPRLAPGDLASVALRVPSRRRGRHEVAGFDAVLVDDLGLARRRLSGIAAFRYGVRPLAESLPGTLPSGEGGAELETTRSAAERLRSGSSLLRPYVPGDELRRVHWPTTARVGDLMVREGGDVEQDASFGITVVLSPLVPSAAAPEWRDGAFEDAVRFSASLLTSAEREGSFRLVVPGRADLGEGFGPRHLDGALELLTDVHHDQAAGEVTAGLSSLGVSADARAVIFVGACGDRSQVSQVFGEDPWQRQDARAAVVAVVCAGAPDSAIELLAPRRLLVRAPLGASLEELWTGSTSVLVYA